MNNDNNNQFGKEFSLTDAERIRMKNVLRAHMAANPLARVEPLERPVPSPYFRYWVRKPATFVAAVLVISLVGGTTSYAAEGALPGDLLYSIKTLVNEPVREALAVSVASQASVQADIASRRLDEAQQLAAAGRLSTSTATDLNSDFEDHASKADDATKRLAVSDPAAALEINSSLAARIAANKDVLEALSNDAEDGGAVTGILASLSARLATRGDDRGEGIRAAATSSESSLLALASRAQDKLSKTPRAPEAEMKLATTMAIAAPASAGDSLASQADAAANLAASRYAEGESALAEGDHAGAYSAFLDSLNASERAKIYSKAVERFGGRAKSPQPRSGTGGTGSVSSTSEIEAHRSGSNSGSSESGGAIMRGEESGGSGDGSDSQNTTAGTSVNASTSIQIKIDDSSDEEDSSESGKVRINLGL